MRVVKKTPQLLPLLLLFMTIITPTSGEEFTLGLLIPLKSSTVSTSSEGKFYAPAIIQAVDDINNSSDLLPGHHVSFIYNDTECDEDKSLRALSYQIHERQVSAIIGPGCTCRTEARLASSLDIPMISYVSVFFFSSHYLSISSNKKKRSPFSKSRMSI